MIELDVLRFLFAFYQEDSNLLYDITPVCGADALMISNKLVRSGLIKDNVEKDTTSVRCAISIHGIESIQPGFIQSNFDNFFPHTGAANSIWNVVDILKQKPEGFQFSFDLANEMQNRDFVKLLYAFYPTKVMVEMTLKARDYEHYR
jgi:hypothetical protein